MSTPSLLPTLPGRWYTDPAVFTAEQAAIFESQWCCVLRAADLAARRGSSGRCRWAGRA